MRVALVEDNAIFCFLFKRFLEEYPARKIEVQLFSDGKKALDYFVSTKDEPSFHPNLIFIDINMPIMNGWELIDNLMNYKFEFIHNSHVYIVSSSKSPLDRSNYREYNFIKDYITKPIDREGIYKILDEYIRDESK